MAVFRLGQKKAIPLPDRNSGMKSNWGVVFTKKDYKFQLLPEVGTLKVIEDPKKQEDALDELRVHLQTLSKASDHFRQLFQVTNTAQHTYHVETARLREGGRTFVAFRRDAPFNEVYKVIKDVDEDFVIVENVVTLETVLESKPRLFGVQPATVEALGRPWVEAILIGEDRIRTAFEMAKQEPQSEETRESEGAES